MKHWDSRFQYYQFTKQPLVLKDVIPCGPCFAKLVVGKLRFARRKILQIEGPSTMPQSSGNGWDLGRDADDAQRLTDGCLALGDAAMTQVTSPHQIEGRPALEDGAMTQDKDPHQIEGRLAIEDGEMTQGAIPRHIEGHLAPEDGSATHLEDDQETSRGLLV